MLQKHIKKNNSTIQKAISELISEGLRHEISNMVRLEGEKLKGFIDMFNLEYGDEPEIYYNNYNVLFCQQNIYDQIFNYLKKDSLVVKIEIPKVHINVWCHEMFADPLFTNFFDELPIE